VDFCRKSQLPTLNLEEEWVPTPQDSSVDRVVIKEALESVLHRLPARQAITLLLMDVYAFTAKETAYRIDATEGAVTMALKRARTNVQQLVAGGELVSISSPSSEGGRNSELIKQLVLAFERHDPEFMIIAYLKLTSNGMKVKRIVRTGTTLYFAISDPNGIEILVYAK
jgi:RNA polymerase sigma-70 factor (ECF subfamily)